MSVLAAVMRVPLTSGAPISKQLANGVRKLDRLLIITSSEGRRLGLIHPRQQQLRSQIPTRTSWSNNLLHPSCSFVLVQCRQDKIDSRADDGLCGEHPAQPADRLVTLLRQFSFTTNITQSSEMVD